MHPDSLVVMAAVPTVVVVRNITADQLHAPTPCSEYDVRRLVKHLLFWGPSLLGAAQKEPVTPLAASEHDVDLAGDDWAGMLEAQIDRTVAAWGKPDAWAGTTYLGGPPQLPAATIGGMVLGELVVHGWDLARATGQQVRWDDEMLDFLHQEVAKTAEQGRDLGVYGNRVQVPETASLLVRILGLTGRDPNWTAVAGSDQSS
jgi:uncharacterized protein (TIGR03086 family)